MILDALTRYYQAVNLPRPGWSKVKVSYGLKLNPDGSLQNVVSYLRPAEKGNKQLPQSKEVPEPVKRSSGVNPNFLCDNSAYLLGVDQKGKPERAKKCFEAAKAFHQKLLAGVDSPAAQAVLAYFEHWDPDTALSHPEIAQNPDLTAGGNVIFLFGEDRENLEHNEVQRDPAVVQAWQQYRNENQDGPAAFCPVLEQTAPMARLHPAIKGVRGAQSSGASLISYNADAFCSYGKEQGENAGISQQAAFAYTTALNYLLSDYPTHLWNTATQEKVDPQKSRFRYASQLGDTTVVYWAEGGDPAYQEFYHGMIEPESLSDAKEEVNAVLSNLTNGKTVDIQGMELDPGVQFYILGISPNAARLSVRFFLQDSFGVILGRIQEHQQRLEIVKPVRDPRENLSFWQLLQETVNPNSKDKNPAPLLGGALVRSVLEGLPYPAALLEGVFVRLRAERNINRGKAAILKAYYLKNPNSGCPKEVLTVALNKDSKSVPYHLGRWFAVLEGIQQDANPGINATIRDKYFSSAASTPAAIFALLVQLSQKHLAKLSEGQTIFYSKLIQEITDHIPDELPTRLSLPEQASFYLGYYHQTQDRYTKKED